MEESDSDELQNDESSSSEGELNVMSSSPSDENFPKFDVTSWNPQPPAGINFLCLIPFASSYNDSHYEQHAHTNKVKASQVHRQRRMKEFKSGQTTGRNIADEKRLRNAANNNELNVVIQLLDSGVDVCCYDDKKRSPLHFAASQGYETIDNNGQSLADWKFVGDFTPVKVLLDKGANPNQKDMLGNTALHLAACTGHVPVVTLLLRAGTDICSVDRSGRTPLSVAKSRLRFLVEEKSYTSERVKNEALQVSEMMKTYLRLSGMNDDADQLDILCDQLRKVSTRVEMDNVNTLMADLASLSLEKKSKPP